MPFRFGGDAVHVYLTINTHVRPVSADADIGKIARQMCVRGVAVELAVQQVREPSLVDPRPVRFESSARTNEEKTRFWRTRISDFRTGFPSIMRN